MPLRGNGPCGGENAAWGDCADEAGETDQDHQVPRGGGVVRYLKFREPYTVEPSACRHANKTGMIVVNKKSWPVQMGAVPGPIRTTWRGAWTWDITARWEPTRMGEW
jgi:hypothetical protein